MGKDTSPVESFDFEEFPESPVHEDYLWGNPAFSVAFMLAQSFSESGWEKRPAETLDLDGLPLHAWRQNGNSEVKPCAEVLLTEDTIDQILAAGLMPLVSLKGRDGVRLARFQSIADPPTALFGRWMR
jgi:type VI secretion system protein ImpC